jgi:hypothetical protein
MQKKAAGEAARQKALEKQQKAASALEGSSSNAQISSVEVSAPYYIPLRLLNNAAVMRYRWVWGPLAASPWSQTLPTSNWGL